MPFPVPGLTEVIHDGTPEMFHDVQLVLIVNDVEPVDEPTVILAGDTVKTGGAALWVMVTICVRPQPLTVNVAVRD